MMLRKFISMALAMLILVMAVPVFDGTGYAAMPYCIGIDLTNQIVTIYKTSDQSIVRQMLCSGGLYNYTPTGVFEMPRQRHREERQEWYYFDKFECYAKWGSRIYEGILFHSIPYQEKKESTISKKAIREFGQPASHGCIRLRVDDAYFIAMNCLAGTQVKIYYSGKVDEDLREMLMAASYTGQGGQTYNQYLGIPDEIGAMGRFSEGSEVLNLQYRLRDLGIYDGPINGEYRASTVNAVRQVQAKLNLAQTGIADSELQEIIYSADAPSGLNVNLNEGMSGPAVRTLQENLKTLKIYNGDTDGVYDVDVSASVKVFQEAYGYALDGAASSEVQKAIDYEAQNLRNTFGENAGYSMEIVTVETYMGRLDSSVGVRLRAKASTESDALARMTNGDIVMALEYGKSWSRVRFGKIEGYVKNVFMDYWKQELATLKYTASDEDKVYTIGYTSEQYAQGASLPRIVFADYLANLTSDDDNQQLISIATVDTEDGITLNLRATPSTNGNILAALPADTHTKVILQSSEWSLVEVDGMQGYLLNEYLEFWKGPEDTVEVDEPAEEAETDAGDIIGDLYAVVTPSSGDRAKVYDLDSDDANVLGHLNSGINVQIVETVDGWSLISYQGHTGYMKDADLRLIMDAQAI